MSTLRYSPRNWLVVDWPFSTCSLPEPLACKEAETTSPPCKPKPIITYPDTYDWAKFLPEVMIGVEDPNPDIAANYTRQAAIEFARDAHVLQRELVIDLEPGINNYPLPAYPDERIAGVLRIDFNDRYEDCNSRCGMSAQSDLGFFWTVDTAVSELRLEGQPRLGRLTIRVWAVPTEDACSYDRFLYDNFRAEITIGARRYYVIANHFRDRALVAVLPPQDRWNYAILSALRQAHRQPSARRQQTGSGMWAGGTGRTSARGYSRGSF